MILKQFWVELHKGMNEVDPSLGMELSRDYGVLVGKKTQLSIPFEQHIRIELTCKLTSDYMNLVVGNKLYRVVVGGKESVYTDADLARKAMLTLQNELYSSVFVGGSLS